MVAISHGWPVGIRNKGRVIQALKFSFHFILINLNSNK